MIPLYTFDHALFLALNFDGGPVMDRLMTLVSGTAMWLPLYALILWLVWRREGWRRTLLFAAAIVLAIVLADMAAGIFKHSGPLKGLWADFPPRWRPMFTPSLEGLEIAPDTLMRWRFEGHATPGIVHVPEGALGGKFGTVSSHAATVVALLVLSAAEIRRRWFTFLMVADLSGQALPRRPAAGSGRRGAHRLGDAAGIPLHRADPPAAPPGKEAEAGIKAAVRNRGPKPLRRGTEQFRIFFVTL